MMEAVVPDLWTMLGPAGELRRTGVAGPLAGELPALLGVE